MTSWISLFKCVKYSDEEEVDEEEEDGGWVGHALFSNPHFEHCCIAEERMVWCFAPNQYFECNPLSPNPVNALQRKHCWFGPSIKVNFE